MKKNMNMDMNEILIWHKTLTVVMGMPGVKIDRESFLRREFQPYYPNEQLTKIIKNKPSDYVSSELINKIANSCIKNHTSKVTALSAAAGIPGGLAMFGTIPADAAQYFYHVFVLSQKLCYLYGFPDLYDENGNINDTALDLMTLFVGVMMGVDSANSAINIISKSLAKQTTKKLSRMALTKTTVYPIVKRVATMLGIKINKDIFAKSVGKIIPFIGGVISGGLTYFSFHPCAKRLQRELIVNMYYFNNNFRVQVEGVDYEEI